MGRQRFAEPSLVRSSERARVRVPQTPDGLVERQTVALEISTRELGADLVKKLLVRRALLGKTARNVRAGRNPVSAKTEAKKE